MVEHLGLSTTPSAPLQPAAAMRAGLAKPALPPTQSVALQPPVIVGLSPQGSLAVRGFNAPGIASRVQDGGDTAAALAALSKLGQDFRKAAAAARLSQACGRLNALKEASRMLAAGGNPRAAIQMAREAAALAKEVNAAAKDYAALCGSAATIEPASGPAIATASAGGDPQAGASDAADKAASDADSTTPASTDGSPSTDATSASPHADEATAALAQARSAIDDAKTVLRRAKRVVAAALQVDHYSPRHRVQLVNQQDLGDLRKAQADIGAAADGLGASGM